MTKWKPSVKKEKLKSIEKYLKERPDLDSKTLALMHGISRPTLSLWLKEIKEKSNG